MVIMTSDMLTCISKRGVSSSVNVTPKLLRALVPAERCYKLLLAQNACHRRSSVTFDVSRRRYAAHVRTICSVFRRLVSVSNGGEPDRERASAAAPVVGGKENVSLSLSTFRCVLLPSWCFTLGPRRNSTRQWYDSSTPQFFNPFSVAS